MVKTAHRAVATGCQCLRELALNSPREFRLMGWWLKNKSSSRAAVPAARNYPRASSDSIIICPGDDRKCPYGGQWSELQRDDRIAAECASHPLPRNKFSLLPWQAVAATAALPHSCLDHQRMLMRRMQGRRSPLQIGPTSRTRDSVWFLFPCCDFDPAANLSKLIPPIHFVFLGQPTFTTLREECFSPSKENVRDERCSDAPLPLRYGRLRLRRAYHRSRRQIPTSNLPPTIALR
jgi:hypothetical protein